MIITLNSFWGRLFISISSSFSEVLSCTFIWNIFLALILLKSLCLLGFPCGSAGKESTCNAGDLSSILGLGRYTGVGLGTPPLYYCLENPHGQRNLVGYSPQGHTIKISFIKELWWHLEFTTRCDHSRRARYPGMWSQVGLRKHHYEQS